MAEAPSYTTVPGRIPELLKKVRDTGVPPKATQEWLKSLGFKSSNDRTLLRVLRQIGFIDANGVPTPAWKRYRGADHKQVLGRAIVEGYPSLYGMYADAHVRSATELGHVFSTQSDAGKQTIDKTVSTFKALASEAEFDGAAPEAPEGAPQPTQVNATGRPPADTSPLLPPPAHFTSAGMTVNVNVQLTLPETTDDAVFAAFFKAMRKHLLSNDDQ